MQDGPCILILPSMTMNETLFPDFGRPTIAVDFNDLHIGRDGSSAELLRDRMRLYVRLLDERLRDEPVWQGPPKVVVAHSFGGMLALEWLLHNRAHADEHVRGLVLIGTTAGPMYEVLRLRVFASRGREWRIPLAPILPFWNRPTITRALKRAVSAVWPARGRIDFRSIARRSDVALDLAGWRHTDWRAMRSYRLAMEGFDVRDRLAEIATPTIVLHGDRDSLIPPAAGRDLAARLPNGCVRLIRGAAHGLPLTHPEAVLEAVEDLRRP